MDRTLRAAPPHHRLSRHAALLAGAIALASLAAPAGAASGTSAKLVSCGAQSCLLITGHRDDPASIVTINGQAVSVEGKRGWRVSLPVETVRQLSAPYAREIEVSLRDPATQSETSDSVDLPVGLLGGLTDLSALEVSIN